MMNPVVGYTSRQWDENGEHCVEFSEKYASDVPVPADAIALDVAHSLRGVEFTFTRRDTGMAVRVSEIGLSRFFTARSPRTGRKLDEMGQAQFVRVVEQSAQVIGPLIFGALAHDNPANAVLVAHGEASA